MSALPMPELAYTIHTLRRMCEVTTQAISVLRVYDHRIRVNRLLADTAGAAMTSGYHTHSFYEAIIVLRGEVVYDIERTHYLYPASVLLLPPFLKHAWRVSHGNCARLTLELHIDPPLDVLLPDAWPQWPEMLWDLSILFCDIDQRAPELPLLITTRMTAIISRLMTFTARQDVPPAAPPPMQFVDVVDTFLRDNLARPLTVAQVAAHVGMSERSLMRHFRHLTGDTLIRRLHKLRMDRATALLADTDCSVAQIGELVGIPDPAYFCSRFKAYCHSTPLQYRQQMFSER